MMSTAGVPDVTVLGLLFAGPWPAVTPAAGPGAAAPALRGAGSLTPEASASASTAAWAPAARSLPPGPIATLDSTWLALAAGCPGQLKPSPSGITTSRRCL